MFVVAYYLLWKILTRFVSFIYLFFLPSLYLTQQFYSHIPSSECEIHSHILVVKCHKQPVPQTNFILLVPSLNLTYINLYLFRSHVFNL